MSVGWGTSRNETLNGFIAYGYQHMYRHGYRPLIDFIDLLSTEYRRSIAHIKYMEITGIPNALVCPEYMEIRFR